MQLSSILKFKTAPVFNMAEDIAQIKNLPPADGKEPPFKDQGKEPSQKDNKISLPYMRAYILTKQLEPIAIFNQLPYEGYESFVRLVLCMTPDDIAVEGYHQIDVMNTYKIGIRKKWIKRPFKIAFFMADKLWYHLSIPVDLMIYLCVRFRDFDIVDRDFWGIVTAGDQPHG